MGKGSSSAASVTQKLLMEQFRADVKQLEAANLRRQVLFYLTADNQL